MFEIIHSAGWPIVFLLIASVLAVALILERLFSLRSIKVLPPKLLAEVKEYLGRQKPSPDYLRKLKLHSPLGAVFSEVLRNAHKPASLVQECVEQEARQVAHHLEHFLNGLGTVASVAPLLGLLGTIVGMIEIFGAQSSVTVSPQQLAHGISVALYNTCFGLIVAIPSLIFYRYFKQRVHAFMLVMEEQAFDLIRFMSER